ncbi:PREDICTED: uncharacterized protein LOC104724284 isoform X2 [Camelina sativa]|uniref:Uncharacterized protein LOC104724284 isoform X2 n=1 Tax=Camelina sativa TaxID=90675 RepID=A0ABM1QN46_CAMSA|nr:PREDICTED: uncharacterized protein LOC104724284 isoform X2 [Camelina sativa]
MDLPLLHTFSLSSMYSIFIVTSSCITDRNSSPSTLSSIGGWQSVGNCSHMEKASLSKISFDDTSGTVKKAGGMFKEKLRKLGGLDAVFDVVMDCHAVMEDLLCNGKQVHDRRTIYIQFVYNLGFIQHLTMLRIHSIHPQTTNYPVQISISKTF